MTPFLLALPWALFVLVTRLRVRLPWPLPPFDEARRRLEGAGPAWAAEGAPEGPMVSVIVPARNEAHNVATVLGSLAASVGVPFEVILVDDRSGDGTGTAARAFAERLASAAREGSPAIEVVDGEPLPDGWLGKPWACHQGAARARGRYLLFTDADTTHGPDLLARAVGELEGDAAGALTLLGRQTMESFWERLLQPTVFALLFLRFANLRDPLPPERWIDAIANGQYILIRREAYVAIGGHEAVKGEVVEDLRLAQILVRNGHRLVFRLAEDAFATRMYRGLGEIVRGWSKNIIIGSFQSVPPFVRPFVAPVGIVTALIMWVLPPVALALAGLGVLDSAWLWWSVAVVTISLLYWATWYRRMGTSAAFGLLYPLGSAVSLSIYVRAWLRGTRVEWKGRAYRVTLDE